MTFTLAALYCVNNEYELHFSYVIIIVDKELIILVSFCMGFLMPVVFYYKKI